MTTPNTPHPLKDIINAMADRVEVEMKSKRTADSWTTWYPELTSPLDENSSDFLWRIKPEVKPDITNYMKARTDGDCTSSSMPFSWANLKLTFDGETGDLKDAEVL